MKDRLDKGEEILFVCENDNKECKLSAEIKPEGIDNMYIYRSGNGVIGSTNPDNVIEKYNKDKESFKLREVTEKELKVIKRTKRNE